MYTASGSERPQPVSEETLQSEFPTKDYVAAMFKLPAVEMYGSVSQV